MKIQQSNKFMACKFFSWYISHENENLIYEELLNIKSSKDYIGDMYDIFLTKYFTPETI